MFPVTVSVQMDSIQIHTSTSRQAVISIAPLTQQNLDDIFMKHIKKKKVDNFGRYAKGARAAAQTLSHRVVKLTG